MEEEMWGSSRILDCAIQNEIGWIQTTRPAQNVRRIIWDRGFFPQTERRLKNWLLLIELTYVTKIQTWAYKYLIWFQQTAVFKKKINNDGWGFMGWFEKSYVDKRIRFLIGRLNFERHDRVHIIHCTVSVHDNILSTDVQQSLAWVGIWFWWNPLAVVQIRCGSLPDRENVWTTGLCNNAIPWNNWES